MKNILIVSLLALGGLVVSSCGEDCESCNTTANFTMSEGFLNLGEHNVWEEEDTVSTFSDIQFAAICDDMTRYEWKVGTDNRTFTEPSFTLYFTQPATIEVKLIVYKDEDLNCPDNTIRVDSIMKVLTIIDKEITYVPGIYRGYNTDNPNHEFDIEIRFDSTEAILGAYVIHNLPEGCHLPTSNRPPTSILTFRNRFYMDFNRNRPSCEHPKGWGRLEEDRNILIIDYFIKNFDAQTLIPYQFIGKRI